MGFQCLVAQAAARLVVDDAARLAADADVADDADADLLLLHLVVRPARFGPPRPTVTTQGIFLG